MPSNVNLHEGGHIFLYPRLAGDVGKIADGDEVVHADHAEQIDVIAQLDMPCQHDIVGQDAVVADLHVVSDVAVNHEQVIASDTGDLAADFGAGVDGACLADLVAVADFQAHGAAAVFFVLRIGPDDAVGIKDVLLPNGGVADEHDMAEQPVARPQRDVRADHAERTDLDVIGDDGLWIDLRQGRNFRHK